VTFLIIVGALIYTVLREPSRENLISIDNDPYIGPVNAPVTIVEFSDFQCPYCAEVALKRNGIKDMVLNLYKGKVKLVYRDFPLLSIHRYAKLAAEAAQSAFEQGRFWEYHDILFMKQAEWGNNSLSEEKVKMLLISYAKDLGLNVTQFSRSLNERKYTDEVEKDRLDGLSYGVRGTPTFFVGVEVDSKVKVVAEEIVGFDFEKIVEAIEKALTIQSE
jgi:protein-disulfide isomerase